jgi:peptide chain release factor 2
LITQDQLKDILDRAEALHKYLDIDRKKIEYEEEDLRTQAPDFWDDPERARAQMKVVGELKKWLDGYKEVRTSADELQLSLEFYRDAMLTE